jgi:hypothetical protein
MSDLPAAQHSQIEHLTTVSNMRVFIALQRSVCSFSTPGPPSAVEDTSLLHGV